MRYGSRLGIVNNISYSCQYIDDVIDCVENIRGINDQLRDLATQYAQEADDLEIENIELGKDVARLQDEISRLERSLRDAGFD